MGKKSTYWIVFHAKLETFLESMKLLLRQDHIESSSGNPMRDSHNSSLTLQINKSPNMTCQSLNLLN